MDAVFRLVLIASFYGSIVGVIIILLKTLLRNKLNAGLHYAIWSLLILKLLIPVGPESAISLFNRVPVFVSQEVPTVLPAGLPKVVSEGYENNSSGFVAAKEPKDLHVESTNQTHLSKISFDNMILYIWLFGVIFMFGWLSINNYLLYRKLKIYGSSVDYRMKLILNRCKSKMGINRDIELVVQQIINTPSLLGIIKPKVLLTPNLLDLSDKELQYILLHELAHYKRKDIFINHLLLVLQVIHWFNPFIWYCFKRIRQDMEVATDEKVLNILEKSEHREYGMVILALLERFNSSRLAPKLIGIVDDKKNIERRIKMIKMADLLKSKRKMVLTLGIVCMIFLSVLLLTSGMNHKNKGDKNDISDKKLLSNHTLPEKNFLSLSGFDKKTIKQIGYSFIGDSQSKSIEVTDKKDIAALVNELNRTTIVPYIDEGDMKMPKNSFFVSLGNDESYYYFFIDKDNGSIAPNYSPLSSSFPKFTHRFENIKQLGVLVDLLEEALSSKMPKTIEEAVKQAIISEGSSYYVGEVITEGHIILDVEEVDGKTKVYAITSRSSYGFENGIFTNVSGSGSPAVITFSKNEKGEYSILEYEEPLDGKGYLGSIKKIFPQRLWDKVLSVNKPNTLREQQEEQARQYLESIGRNAEISASVEKKSIDIDTEASNKLFAEYAKYNVFLNDCPYWIGTKEKIENGARYIYETSQNKSREGYDIIVFKKTREDGSVVHEYQYKIVGSEPVLIGQNSDM